MKINSATQRLIKQIKQPTNEAHAFSFLFPARSAVNECFANILQGFVAKLTQLHRQKTR